MPQYPKPVNVHMELQRSSILPPAGVSWAQFRDLEFRFQRGLENFNAHTPLPRKWLLKVSEHCCRT